MTQQWLKQKNTNNWLPGHNKTIFKHAQYCSHCVMKSKCYESCESHLVNQFIYKKMNLFILKCWNNCVCPSTVITGKKLCQAITWALWIPQKCFIFQKFPLNTNKNNMCFKDLSFLFTWYFVKNQTNSEMAKKLAKHDFSLLKPPPPTINFF